MKLLFILYLFMHVKSEIGPMVGILPMIIPRFHRQEMKGSFYVASTFSKFFEQAGIDWVPLDVSSDSNLLSSLSLVSGVLIPSSNEVYDIKEDIEWYRAKVNLIISKAKEINLTRFFPVIGLGFGAQLLLSSLSQNSIPLSPVSIPGLQYPLKWTAPAASLFEQTFPQKDLIQSVNYPFSNLNSFLMESVTNNSWFKENAIALAEVKPTLYKDKVVLAAFELKALPLFGFFFDVNRIQFFHDETFDIPKKPENEEAAFAFSLGLARLLKKGECKMEYSQAIAKKSAWNWTFIPGFSAEFDDVFYL